MSTSYVRLIDRVEVPASEALGSDGRIRDGYGVRRPLLAMDSKRDIPNQWVSVADAINGIPREYTPRYARVVADLARGTPNEIENALHNGADVVRKLRNTSQTHPQCDYDLTRRAADFLEGTMDAAKVKLDDRCAISRIQSDFLPEGLSESERARAEMSINLSDAWRN
jgi:hypothetical protein